MEIIVTLAAIPIIAVIAVTATVLVQVKLLSMPEKYLKRDDACVEPIKGRLDAKTKAWIESNGFDFLAAYRFMQTPFAAWRKRGSVTDLVIYGTQAKIVYDLATYLQDGTGLTTSIGGETGMFPIVPGNYKESVAVRNLHELAAAHTRSLKVLESKRGIHERDEAPPFEEELILSMCEQMAHVKTYSFWPFRGLYWFFVKRRQMRGKTVEEQIRQGLA